jgi:carboxyl-terminal processing protease
MRLFREVRFLRAICLKKGDKIIGVGQGLTGEIVDVLGWRINDVVKLIRGKKGHHCSP